MNELKFEEIINEEKKTTQQLYCTKVHFNKLLKLKICIK